MISSWLWQSFVATAALVPVWIAVGFFNRNFHVPSAVFLVWYFFGTALCSALFGVPSLSSLVPSWGVVGAMLGIGFALGGIINISLFRAVEEASRVSNPGLPIAITNLVSVGVFLLVPVLARFAPKFFDPVRIDPVAFLGVVLCVVGASLVAIRN